MDKDNEVNLWLSNEMRKRPDKAEDEEEFVKCLRELYFKCYGENLPEWQEYYMTTLYCFHKQHPNAKIAYGRYGLQIVIPKEEDDASRN